MTCRCELFGVVTTNSSKQEHDAALARFTPDEQRRVSVGSVDWMWCHDGKICLLWCA